MILLALYSAALIVVELRTSQDFVRNYFTDIEGPVPFFAVNTTISVFLLWSTALMFVVCLATIDGVSNETRIRWFFISQVVVFAYLGFDDRFIYEELQLPLAQRHLPMIQLMPQEAAIAFQDWIEKTDKVEY